MVQIATSVEKIRAACEAVGISEFARLSGVNYTTIRALAESQFRPKTVKILEKLEAAANEVASKPSSSPEAGVGSAGDAADAATVPPGADVAKPEAAGGTGFFEDVAERVMP